MTIRSALRALTGMAAVVALALPAAASAQTFVHIDPAHDVQKLVDGTASDASTNKKADIVRVRLTHTSQEVTGSVKLRRLNASNDWSLMSEIKTPIKKYALVVRRAGSRTQVSLANKGGTALKCTGLDFQVKKLKKVVVYRLPATCIAKPKWVRVGIGFTVPIGSTGVYGDDGLATSQADGANLSLSKRLTK
jgi:hypothetical protein